MEDFTGGVTEIFQLKKVEPQFYKIIKKSQDRASLMCTSIEAKPKEIEAKLDNGLIKGHAYSVTGMRNMGLKGVSITALLWWCEEMTRS